MNIEGFNTDFYTKDILNGIKYYNELKDIIDFIYLDDYMIDTKEFLNVIDSFKNNTVTDGYTGNTFLKSSEGMAKMMKDLIKGAFKRNFLSKLGYLFVRKGIKEMSATMDYKSTGGAMLLGINGVVVKAHGSSDSFAFECAINVAYKLVKENIVSKIKDGIRE